MESNNAMVVRHSPEASLALQKVSDGLFKSGLFPNAKNVYGAFAIVEYGHELGIPPMMALKNINLIKGQLAANGQLMLSLAMNRGVTYKVIAESDKGATIEFKRGEMTYTATFNEADAKAAGLLAKDNWKMYARDMYFWRAAVKGIRRVAPDAVMGLYTKDEISNGEIIDPPRRTEGAGKDDEIVAQLDGDTVDADFIPAEGDVPDALGDDKTADAPAPKDEISLVRIENIERKEFNTQPGAPPLVAYFIHTATGGVYGTYDKLIADKARSFKDSGEMVALHSKPGATEGSRVITEMELAA